MGAPGRTRYLGDQVASAASLGASYKGFAFDDPMRRATAVLSRGMAASGHAESAIFQKVLALPSARHASTTQNRLSFHVHEACRSGSF